MRLNDALEISSQTSNKPIKPTTKSMKGRACQTTVKSNINTITEVNVEDAQEGMREVMGCGGYPKTAP